MKVGSVCIMRYLIFDVKDIFVSERYGRFVNFINLIWSICERLKTSNIQYYLLNSLTYYCLPLLGMILLQSQFDNAYCFENGWTKDSIDNDSFYYDFHLHTYVLLNDYEAYQSGDNIQIAMDFKPIPFHDHILNKDVENSIEKETIGYLIAQDNTWKFTDCAKNEMGKWAAEIPLDKYVKDEEQLLTIFIVKDIFGNLSIYLPDHFEIDDTTTLFNLTDFECVNRSCLKYIVSKYINGTLYVTVNIENESSFETNISLEVFNGNSNNTFAPLCGYTAEIDKISTCSISARDRFGIFGEHYDGKHNYCIHEPSNKHNYSYSYSCKNNCLEISTNIDQFNPNMKDWIGLLVEQVSGGQIVGISAYTNIFTKSISCSISNRKLLGCNKWE